MKRPSLFLIFIILSYPSLLLAQNYPTTTSRGDVVETYFANNNVFEIGLANIQNARRAWILSRHHSTTGYGHFYSTLHLQPDVGTKSQYRGVAIGYEASRTISIGTHLAVEGKVGVGTTNPTHSLEVNGTIRAKEVILEATNWPDYVFSNSYQLPSLEETKTYIKTHGHLPGLKSATEYEKEGVNMMELNQKLLEKIEELTLHIIRQEARIDSQQGDIDHLKSVVKMEMKSTEGN